MLIIMMVLPIVFALAAFLPVRHIFRVKMLCTVALLHLILTGMCWVKLPSPEFNGYLVLDSLGLIFLTVMTLLFFPVSIFMLGYFEHEKRDNRIFIASIMLLISTTTMVAASYHMGLLWVAIETTTLFSAPLISFHRRQETLEATWKYLLVCSVGIALALMGTFFLAIAAHETHTLLLPVILSGAASLSGNWLKLSVIFLLVGYGCKMGLAPMHSWKPEAYGQATGMVAVLLAGGLTQCSFLALVRVNQICIKAGLSDFYVSILLLTGVLSLLIAAMSILGQSNIKKAFAYSSIEQMGILVIGLALGGVGLFGALLHMITNALSKVVMFLTAGSIAQKYGSSRVSEVQGVIHKYPVTGILLLMALFAGTGVFPFATFHSELMILNSAVMSRHYVLAGILGGCLMIIFIGIARIILDVVYGTPTDPKLPAKENFFMNAAIIMGVVALIALGLWMPAPLSKVIHDAVFIVDGTWVNTLRN